MASFHRLAIDVHTESPLRASLQECQRAATSAPEIEDGFAPLQGMAGFSQYPPQPLCRRRSRSTIGLRIQRLGHSKTQARRR